MQFEIHVYHEDTFLFSTNKDNLSSPQRLKNVHAILLDKFPEAEGYKLIVRQLVAQGRTMTAAEIAGVI